MVLITRSLFFPPKNKRLARIITITSPAAFRRSIKVLMKDGLSVTERKALILARTRAKVQLKRKNLSDKERKQMLAISKIRIPKANK